MSEVQAQQNVKSACPSCGQVSERTAYDIGDGPELSCASCEWCWGANGQPLKPIYSRVVRDLGYNPLDKMREQRETGDCNGE